MKFRNNKSNSFLRIYDGYQLWYKTYSLHRLNGPARIGPNGYRAWFQNGNFHRLNGPAVIWADGHKEWWENGVRIK